MELAGTKIVVFCSDRCRIAVSLFTQLIKKPAHRAGFAMEFDTLFDLWQDVGVDFPSELESLDYRLLLACPGKQTYHQLLLSLLSLREEILPRFKWV